MTAEIDKAIEIACQYLANRIRLLESQLDGFVKRVVNLQHDYDRVLKELNEVKRYGKRGRKATRGTASGRSNDDYPVYP